MLKWKGVPCVQWMLTGRRSLLWRVGQTAGGWFSVPHSWGGEWRVHGAHESCAEPLRNHVPQRDGLGKKEWVQEVSSFSGLFSGLSSQGEIEYISCACVWNESRLNKICISNLGFISWFTNIQNHVQIYYIIYRIHEEGLSRQNFICGLSNLRLYILYFAHKCAHMYLLSPIKTTLLTLFQLNLTFELFLQ